MNILLILFTRRKRPALIQVSYTECRTIQNKNDIFECFTIAETLKSHRKDVDKMKRSFRTNVKSLFQKHFIQSQLMQKTNKRKNITEEQTLPAKRT